MFYRTLSLTSLITLAACGGSGSSPTTTPTIPLADTGFASGTSNFDTVTAFSLPNTTALLGSEEGVLSFAQQDITFAQVEGSSDIDFTIDGTTYRVPLVDNSDDIATFALDDENIEIEFSNKAVSTDNVSIIELIFLEGDTLASSGDFITGFDTDPDALSELSGSAAYTGELFITARSGFNRSSGTGDVNLDVNFNANTIGGSINVEENTFSSNSFDFPTASFEIEETDISGNGFATTFSQTGGNINGELTSAQIDGRFFGQEGEDIGGQVSAIVEDSDTGETTLVIGGYIASQ